MIEKNNAPVKRRGRPPGSKNKDGTTTNYPSQIAGAKTDEDKAIISKLLTEARAACNMPRVKDDADLEQRIDEYFGRCAQNGIVPTLEEMYLYCGHTRKWAQHIRSGYRPGFSPRTAEILERACETMATFEAKMVIAGKMREVTYIFRGKNYYGMKDEQNVVVDANNNQEQELSIEDITKRYLTDAKTVETSFSDDEPKGE